MESFRMKYRITPDEQDYLVYKVTQMIQGVIDSNLEGHVDDKLNGLISGPLNEEDTVTINYSVELGPNVLLGLLQAHRRKHENRRYHGRIQNRRRGR